MSSIAGLIGVTIAGVCAREPKFEDGKCGEYTLQGGEEGGE